MEGIGFAASIIAAFVGGYYLSKVESTKSKLKKAEILFELRVAAVKKFNEIYQKHNPSNYEVPCYGNVYSRKDLEELRKDIAQYRAEHGYVFEDDKFDKILEEGVSALGDDIDEYIPYESDMEEKGLLTYEEAGYYPHYYQDTVKLISEVNDMMRKYLFEEAKPEVTLWVKFKRFVSRPLCCRK